MVNRIENGGVCLESGRGTVLQFVILRGLPGAGKSRILQELEERGKLGQYVVLDPDKVDTRSRGFSSFVESQQRRGTLQNYVYRYLLAELEQAFFSGKSVIWEQPWSNPEGVEITLDKFLRVLERTPYQVEPVVVEMGLNEWEAWQRVKQRKVGGGHGPDRTKMEWFVQNYFSMRGMFRGVDVVELDTSGIITKVADDFELKVLERTVVASDN